MTIDGFGELENPDSPVEPVGGDLWSAPASAVPVSAALADNLFAGELLDGLPPSSLPPAQIVPVASSMSVARHARRIGRSGGGDSALSGRRGRSGIALALAVTVLTGLALLAQRLDPSRGGGSGASGALSTVNPAPSAGSTVPSTASSTAPSLGTSGAVNSGEAQVVTGGPSDCPMQLTSAGLDCFFIG